MITFVVPVYNSARSIGQCIESMLAQPLDKEAIVADNDSSDGTTDRDHTALPGKLLD